MPHRARRFADKSLKSLVVFVATWLLAVPALAGVNPLLQTSWGQGGDYKSATPTRNGEHTYPGCTTIALQDSTPPKSAPEAPDVPNVGSAPPFGSNLKTEKF